MLANVRINANHVHLFFLPYQFPLDCYGEDVCGLISSTVTDGGAFSQCPFLSENMSNDLLCYVLLMRKAKNSEYPCPYIY